VIALLALILVVVPVAEISAIVIAGAAGLVIGRDFFLAFSPERVDPGNRTYTTATIPKVVGGVTPACTKLAASQTGRMIQLSGCAACQRQMNNATTAENKSASRKVRTRAGNSI